MLSAGIRDAVGDSGTVEFNCGRDVNAAVELAKQSDYAIIFVGTLSRAGLGACYVPNLKRESFLNCHQGEDFDRSSLSLDVGVDWTGQNEASTPGTCSEGNLELQWPPFDLSEIA